MLQQQIQLYKQYLQENAFYDAHEALEELWFPERFSQSNDTKLLKGFINAAVSFELQKRGRHEQSKKVWKNYLKYRNLLFQAKKENLNHFYQLSRYVEKFQREKSLFPHSISI